MIHILQKIKVKDQLVQKTVETNKWTDRWTWPIAYKVHDWSQHFNQYMELLITGRLLKLICADNSASKQGSITTVYSVKGHWNCCSRTEYDIYKQCITVSVTSNSAFLWLIIKDVINHYNAFALPQNQTNSKCRA